MNGLTNVVWNWKLDGMRKWRGTFKTFVPVPYQEPVNGKHEDSYIKAIWKYLVRLIRYDNLRRGKMIDENKINIAIEGIEKSSTELVAM